MTDEDVQLAGAIAAFADSAIYAPPGSVSIFAFADTLGSRFAGYNGRELRNMLRIALRDRELYWREMGSSEEFADRFGWWENERPSEKFVEHH